MKHLVTLFTLVHLGLLSYAQLTFTANFENGRLDSSYLDNGVYVVAPITNLHFAVTNARNQQPLFKIFDVEGYRLRSYHHMVYRYEGENSWHFFDTAYKANSFDYYHFANHSPFSQDTVYIAYWFPYTYSDLQSYLIKIQGAPHLLNAGAKATSYEGRNLYSYEITDTAFSDCYKKHVVIVARQHPTENINGYFVEGLSDYLLFSQDSTAAFLRRNYRFFIYPMLNPDGVVNGSGQNALGQGLNREWEDSLIASGTPEIDSIRPVIWRETGQQVDWAIDIHSNPGSNIPYYWWGYTSSSPVPPAQIIQASDYVRSVFQKDAANQPSSLFQNFIQGDGVSSSKTAGNWFRRTFGAISYTFEPTTEPLGPTGDNRLSVERLKAAGASLAQGFYAVFDTLQALGGSVIPDGNTLIAQVSGGLPPYSFSWSGPVSGSGDTLMHVPDGIYTLLVTDAQGCTWQESIELRTTALDPETGSIGLALYPNPNAGIFTLEFSQPPGEIWVEVMSPEGKVLLIKKKFRGIKFQVDFSDLPCGMYWVRIWNGQFYVVEKFVKLD